MKEVWTQEQIDFLIANVDTMTHAEIGKHIGKNRTAVNTYCFKNKIKTKRYPARYTKEEIAYIEDHFGSMSLEQIAKKLNKSLKSLHRFQTRYRLGPQSMNLVDEACVAQVAQMLGRQSSIVSYWCRFEGLNSRKVGRLRIVKYSDLYKWMQEHPKKWNVNDCYKPAFKGQEWFEKLLEDK